jgi:hypothetical protein
MKAHDPKPDREDFYLCGLSRELRAALQQKARDAERSLTKEILYRLRQSVTADETAAGKAA